MGIRFLCPNGHKLNVKAELAGKRGSCPECGAKLQIPAATAAPQDANLPASSPALTAAPALATVVASPAVAAWHFRSTSGEQHGPLSELQFRASIAAGRVTADTLLWREGWQEWRPARSIPELLPTPLVATAAAAPIGPVPPLRSGPLEIAVPSLDVSTPQPAADWPSEISAPIAAVDESAADDEIAVDTEESGTADPAALATSKYVYQRRKGKQQQITLAVAMFVTVVVLAAVLYFVISLNSGTATDAPVTSSNSPAAPTASP